MNETEHDPTAARENRRLGDEWLDWDGTKDSGQEQIDEKVGTFLALSAGAVSILIAGLCLGWYLAKPRIDQISPLLSTIAQWSALILVAAILLSAALEATLLAKFGASVFPYVWVEKLLLSLLPKSTWLGAKLGISKDRVGNSFIKVHNLVLKGHGREVNDSALLVLLPRCLQKEVRQQVTERVNGKAVRVVTVAGGEEARRAIMEYKPSLVLAVACERDLISGIRDVAQKIRVLAVPNMRPEGPCKNTCVRLDALDDALRFATRRAAAARRS